MRSFKGEPCVLCGVGVSGQKGEHVLPDWLLSELFPEAAGPYTTYINGMPVPRRDGTPRQQTSAGRFQLAVCPRCNGVLAGRFESQATRKLILRMVRLDGPLTPSESEIAGLWFLKTWLLLAHRELRASDDSWKPRRGWHPGPDLNGWMVEGDPPPNGLSVWLVKTDRGRHASETETVCVPEVEVAGNSLGFGFHDFGLTWLDVSVVHHPGWPIAHPLEETGRAIRLWPHLSDGFDVAGLPTVLTGAFKWSSCANIRLASNPFESDLPPLSSSIDFSVLAPFGPIITS